MAYAADHFDWLNIAWDDLMADAFNGGTYGDYIEEEMQPDPDADPVVGPADAVDIVTAEFGNLVTTFMRECYEALAGVRAMRVREGGGDALDWAGISNGDFLVRSGDTIAGTSLGITDILQLDTLFDIDLAAQPSNTMVDGAETIDGLPFVAQNVNNNTRTTYALDGSTGLVWSAPNNQSAVMASSGGDTASRIYIELTNVPNWRAEDDLIVDCYITGTFENGNDAFRFGLHGLANDPRTVATASASRMDMADRGNHSAAQRFRTLHNTTVAELGFDASTFTVISARFRPDGTFVVYRGIYSAGWPALNWAGMQLTNQNVSNPMLGAGTRLTFGNICVADSTPTSTWTLHRVRARRA